MVLPLHCGASCVVAALDTGTRTYACIVVLGPQTLLKFSITETYSAYISTHISMPEAVCGPEITCMEGGHCHKATLMYTYCNKLLTR